jgi:hypothetical protein
MAHHPPSIIVEIVGTEMDDKGRSCKEHNHCGEELVEDMVVRLRMVQVMVEWREETAIAAIWVTDGIDCCHVGFLPRHMVFYATRFDRALAQVTKVLSLDLGHCDMAQRRFYHCNNGCCNATIISCLPEADIKAIAVGNLRKWKVDCKQFTC